MSLLFFQPDILTVLSCLIILATPQYILIILEPICVGKLLIHSVFSHLNTCLNTSADNDTITTVIVINLPFLINMQQYQETFRVI